MESLSERKKYLIERIGLFQEAIGMQPSTARVIGLLLVSDEAELSFEDIQQALNMSKSAVSQSLSILITMRQVEYVTLPGQRRRLFRLKPYGWRHHIESMMENMLEYCQTLQMVASLKQHQEDPARAQSLMGMIAMLELLHKTLKDTAGTWSYPAA